MASRREELEWMPKPHVLAGLFGEEEELPVLPPEELSLEDLDDDEDEDEGDIVDEESPAESELKETKG